MSSYIDADKLQADVKEELSEYRYAYPMYAEQKTTNTMIDIFINILDGCIDDMKRQQGEWINEYWEDAYQEYYHTCDVCKTEIVKTAYDNYCSCCGAKMRKGEKE